MWLLRTILIRIVLSVIQKLSKELMGHPYQGLGALFRIAKARTKIIGAENLPSNGPFIIAINHMYSTWGLVFVIARLYSYVHCPVYTVITERSCKLLGEKTAEWLGLIPDNRHALEKSFSLLKQGKVITLVVTGEKDKLDRNGFLISKPRIGIGFLSKAAPVVPVAFVTPCLGKSLERAGEFIGLAKFLALKQKIKVKIGRPLYFPKEEKITREAAKKRAEAILKKVSSLVAELYNST